MLRVSKAFAPILKANGGGALLNVLSVASWDERRRACCLFRQQVRRMVANQRLAPTNSHPRGRRVLGLHMAYVDTDLTRGFEAPKSSPEDIVRRALDGGGGRPRRSAGR